MALKHKILFIEGRVNYTTPGLIQYATTDMEINRMWGGSFPGDENCSRHRVLSGIDTMEIQRLGETDYYFVYQGEGESKINPKDISNALNQALNDDWNGFDVNKETTFGLSKKTGGTEYFTQINQQAELDVFWDPRNNFIVARGEEALYCLCLRLELYKNKQPGEITPNDIVKAMANPSGLLSEYYRITDSEKSQGAYQ